MVTQENGGRGGAAAAGSGKVAVPMQGTIVKVLVEVGQEVEVDRGHLGGQRRRLVLGQRLEQARELRLAGAPEIFREVHPFGRSATFVTPSARSAMRR